MGFLFIIFRYILRTYHPFLLNQKLNNCLKYMAVKSSCPWRLIRPLRDYILFRNGLYGVFEDPVLTSWHTLADEKLGIHNIVESITMQVNKDDNHDGFNELFLAEGCPLFLRINLRKFKTKKIMVLALSSFLSYKSDNMTHYFTLELNFYTSVKVGHSRQSKDDIKYSRSASVRHKRPEHYPKLRQSLVTPRPNELTKLGQLF